MPPTRVSGVRVDALVQQAREPVFLLGPDRRVLMVNRAWEVMTGRRWDEVAGLAFQAAVANDLGGLEALGASFRPPPEALEGRASSTRTLIVRADGERAWHRLEFWPLHDGEGDLVGLLGMARPVDEPASAPESESLRLAVELEELREEIRSRPGLDVLIGRGPEHRRLLDQVAAASASAAPALIVGERGTGGATVARAIHQRSSRRNAPLLSFDCQALPPETLERQLFGKAAGPGGRMLGALDGATVLVRDVLDLPRDLQARLAAGLDGRFRLLAATAGDPDDALKAETLRPDLFYALTTLVLRLRPLRERLDELPLLAQHFLERANRRGQPGHVSRAGFTRSALDALLAHDWPGNLRELARVVEEAQSRARGDLVDVDDIPARVRGHRGAAYLPPPLPAGPVPLKEMLTRIERRLIEKALDQAGDNKSKAAKLLGVNRPFLYRRIKELGIEDDNGGMSGRTSEDVVRIGQETTDPPDPDDSVISPPDP